MPKFLPNISLGPIILAIVASLAFSMFVYPDVAQDLGNTRIIDRYDALARGLLYSGTLSYYPNPAPTTERTPLFPLVFAVSMALAGEKYIVPGMIMQGLLHGATTFLVMLLVFQFGATRGIASMAGILCALHPILLWYSGRFVIETFLTLLYMLFILVALIYWRKPTICRALATGVVIGLGLWCKAVFAPLLILFPVMIVLRTGSRQNLQHALFVFCAGILTIAPWVYRNYTLTDRWPVLQSVVGLDFYISDAIVETVSTSAISFRELHSRVDFTVMNQQLTAADSLHSMAWCEAKRDAKLVRLSLQRYRNDPLFLVKKMALNAFWFWSLGSSGKASLFTGVLQLSLALLAFFMAWRLLRRFGWSDGRLLPLWFAIIYFGAHLPVFAVARFSAPLIPSLLVLVVTGCGTTGRYNES